MMESPASSLSDFSSEDFPEDVKLGTHPLDPDEMLASARPSKRQRVGDLESAPVINTSIPYDDEQLSSDTDGSVPPSPSHPGDEDHSYDRQVTVCKWEGCEAGDLGNMDNLVEHLHEDHIGIRQKKYSCEWIDCNRKGHSHASGYALRAHMRSHTREKPFFCVLPGMS
jgi:hypothetical protein